MKILFLCVMNSARSQVAEGVARMVLGDRAEVFSAGTNASYVNPFAIRVLEEWGIDAKKQTSKSIAGLPVDEMDLIVTLCAEQVCPLSSARVRRLHWPFKDPSLGAYTDEQILENFRALRDDLKKRIEGLFPE